MISIVRCCVCGSQLEQLGRFAFTLAARTSDWCQECGHSHEDGRSRTWHFCSAKCLRRLNGCSDCGGAGSVVAAKQKDKEAELKRCPRCEGRGVEVST